MTLRSFAYLGFSALGLFALVGCGSVNFGGNSAETAQAQTEGEDKAQSQKQEQAQGQEQKQRALTSDAKKADFDCDELMKELSESCFKVTAFQADGKTPIHIEDEQGNDLGEIDQAWVKDYCECYAGLAFQTFGCETIVKHQSLSDEEYNKLYAPIIASCENSSQEPAANGDAADASTPNGDAADASTPNGDAADASTPNAAPTETAPVNAQ